MSLRKRMPPIVGRSGLLLHLNASLVSPLSRRVTALRPVSVSNPLIHMWLYSSVGRFTPNGRWFKISGLEPGQVTPSGRGFDHPSHAHQAIQDILEDGQQNRPK